MKGEDLQQALFFDWVKWNMRANPLLDAVYAIPNGARTSIRTAVKLKRTGLRKGVMDIHFPYPSKGYIGLWIEMKIKGGKLTPEQKLWGSMMHGFGHCVRVAYNGLEAIEILKGYIE